MKSVQLIVSGRVQGVFFRANIRKKAIELGLIGYARNLPDGNVEIAAQGTENEIKELIAFVKQSPGISKVTDVKIKYKELENFEGFEIRD